MQRLEDKLEFQSTENVASYQVSELKKTLSYLSEKSKFYSRTFNKNNIDISEINTLEDLSKLPVTTKADIQKYYEDFICVEKSEIADYVTTSGTLGQPITFALSYSDLDRLAYNELHSFSVAGVKSGDIIQLMTTIDKRFMAGLAYFLGAKELKCGVIRVGNGIPELQWDTINRVHPNVCIVVPSFLIKLAEYAKINNIDYTHSSLKKAICIGEALKDENGLDTVLAMRIKKLWPNLKLFSTYASTEMQSSFTECPFGNGLHQPMELIIVELLDENDTPVEDGKPGEVTITTLGVEGMPLLRFKTGDICYRISSKCECGRHSYKYSSVIGRKGQMIKFKGTTLYPPALYNVLDNISEVDNYIVEVYTNEIGTDQLCVKIGTNIASEAFEKQIKDLFRAKVRVAPDIIFLNKEEISKIQSPSMSRKIIKFIDRRI